MTTQRRRTGFLLLSLLALAACQSRPPAQTLGRTDRPEPTGAVLAPSGQVVVREYVDPQKIDGKEVYFRIRYVWDYAQGTALFQRFSLDGDLLESTPQPGLTLETTDAEMAYAYQLVREDRELGPRVARADAVFQGGFSVLGAEKPACVPGPSCIRVFVQGGEDAREPLVNAIVDLAGRRIVSRDGRVQVKANAGS